MGTRAVVLALAVLLLAAPSVRAGDTVEAAASRMRMHIENAGMRWTDEPTIAEDHFSVRTAGTLGKAQALLIDLADSEHGLVVTKVDLIRSPDDLTRRGSPLTVTITARLVAPDDASFRQAQWSMPALFSLMLRGVVLSEKTAIYSGQVADGKLQIEGRTKEAGGLKPIVKALDAAAGKLVTSAESKSSRIVQTVADPNAVGGRTIQEESLVTFVVTGTYDARNMTADAMKALSYQ